MQRISASLHKAQAEASHQAAQFAADCRPVILELQRRGHGLRAIARELNRRGIKTLRGREWQAAQLLHILRRPEEPARNPFYFPGPAIVSFSGGRTSGFMLKQIIEAQGGSLPDDIRVVFANTGKERPETLDFVQECSEAWKVPITWLEYAPDAPHKTRIVNHSSASRQGEPFATLIEEKQFLPNPVIRLCTAELKVKRIEAYARHWCHFPGWLNVIGIRYDEPRRVEKLLSGCSGCVKDCGRARGPQRRLPLHQAHIIEDDILAWWHQQPFDLQLASQEGNCDLCFLKGVGKIRAIMRARPDLASWWIDQEARQLGRTSHSGVFRKDRPAYADLLAAIESGRDDLPNPDDGLIDDCACTD